MTTASATVTAPTTAAPPVLLDSSEADALAAYIEDEIAAQQDALTMLREKETVLVRQDPAALTKLLTATQPLLQRLEILTQRRVKLVGQLGGLLGIAAEDVTMTSVLARTREPGRSALRHAQERLRAVLADVGRQNRRNHVLIRHALDTNDALLSVLFGDNSPGRVATYGRSGERREAAPVTPHVSREF